MIKLPVCYLVKLLVWVSGRPGWGGGGRGGRSAPGVESSALFSPEFQPRMAASEETISGTNSPQHQREGLTRLKSPVPKVVHLILKLKRPVVWDPGRKHGAGLARLLFLYFRDSFIYLFTLQSSAGISQVLRLSGAWLPFPLATSPRDNCELEVAPPWLSNELKGKKGA